MIQKIGKLFVLLLIIASLSGAKADNLNLCKPNQLLTVYSEKIVSEALMKKNDRSENEKYMYMGTEFVKGLIVNQIAGITCSPIMTLGWMTGPYTGLIAGSSCYLGTTSGLYNLMPSIKVTNLDEYETFTLTINKIMNDITEIACGINPDGLTNERYFFYFIKQKTLDNNNNLKEIVIDEVIKIDEEIDVKRLTFMPVILSQTYDYKFGMHMYDEKEVIFMFKEGRTNFFLIKTKIVIL
jgi:hypothetical protein